MSVISIFIWCEQISKAIVNTWCGQGEKIFVLILFMSLDPFDGNRAEVYEWINEVVEQWNVNQVFFFLMFRLRSFNAPKSPEI